MNFNRNSLKPYDLFITFDETLQKEYSDLKAKLNDLYDISVYDDKSSFEDVFNDCVCLLVLVNKHQIESKKSIRHINFAQSHAIPFYVLMLEAIEFSEFNEAFSEKAQTKFDFFNQADKMSNLWSGNLFASLIKSINQHFPRRILCKKYIEPEIENKIVLNKLFSLTKLIKSLII